MAGGPWPVAHGPWPMADGDATARIAKPVHAPGVAVDELLIGAESARQRVIAGTTLRDLVESTAQFQEKAFGTSPSTALKT